MKKKKKKDDVNVNIDVKYSETYLQYNFPGFKEFLSNYSFEESEGRQYSQITKDIEEEYNITLKSLYEKKTTTETVGTGGIRRTSKNRNKSRTTKKPKRKLLSHKRKKSSSSRKGKKSSIRQ